MVELVASLKVLRPTLLASSGLCFSLAILGALSELRALERVESPHVNDIRDLRWSESPAGTQTLSLGTMQVPQGGAARLSVCAHGPLRGSLQVQEGGREHTVALHEDSSQSGTKHCYDARWHPNGAQRVDLSLRVTAPRAPALTRLDACAGGVISARNAWPMALMLLAVGLFVLCPRGPREPAPERPELSETPTDALAERVFPSRVLAVLALVGAQVIGQIPTALKGFRSDALLAGLLAQHASLVLFSAALMGALRVRERRPLPLGLVPREKVGRALAAVLGLLTIAGVVGLLVRDAGDTPIGEVLSYMPMRYVIALGALLAPLPEELYFRGALLDAFSRRGEVVGLWVAAVIFTAMHVIQLWGSPVALVPIALVGVVNGYLRVYTRSLTVPWLVHTLYNTALASSVLLDV